MKHGWEIKKLGEVCDVITKGTTPTSLGFQFTDEGVNFIKVESLTELGQIIPNKVAYISEECHQTLKRSQLKTNDILFSIAGALGRIGVVNEELVPANTNQALAIVRLAKDSGISVPFLAKYFTSNNVSEEIEKLRGGAAQQNLSLGQLNNLQIPIPPLPEQQRIVSILDEAFAAIAKAKANAERNLRNAKELFESYLQGVFENKGEDWGFVKLSSLAVDITDGDHMPPPKTSEGVPFITISNINKQSHEIDFSDTFTVSREYFQKLKENRKPRKGDVLYTVTGSYGIPVIIENDLEFCFQRHIGLIRPKESLSSKWLYYWILSPQAIMQANDTATGTAQKTVSLTALRNFVLPKMPLSTQQTIVQKLDALSAETKKLEAIYQQKINDLEEMKKSILQKAFNGELKTT